MKKRLNNHGIDIGIHKTVSLMKEAQIVAIRPRKRHYYPNGGISNVKVKNGNLISQRQIHTGCQTSHIFATTRVGVIWLQFLIWEQKKLLVGHYRKPLIQSLPNQHWETQSNEKTRTQRIYYYIQIRARNTHQTCLMCIATSSNWLEAWAEKETAGIML